MRFKVLLIMLLVTNISFSQSTSESVIDNSNYYKFFQPIKGHSMNWLRASDAIPVIIDELIKNNIPYYTIEVGNLIKIDDTTRLVVTISFKKNNKEYGIVYEPIHGTPLNSHDRDFMETPSKEGFIETEIDVNGNSNFMLVKPLPPNIFQIKQTCYWFQFDNKGTVYKVNKDVIESILRQDIKKYLSKMQ